MKDRKEKKKSKAKHDEIYIPRETSQLRHTAKRLWNMPEESESTVLLAG